MYKMYGEYSGQNSPLAFNHVCCTSQTKYVQTQYLHKQMTEVSTARFSLYDVT